MLTQARLTFGRQQELLKDGWTPRANFDEAQQKLLTAQAQVDSAQAQVRIARESAELHGPVRRRRRARSPQSAPSRARWSTPGRWSCSSRVRADATPSSTSPSSSSARGPRDPVVEIALTNDPQVKATGRVREVAPQADSATRTFQVKVGIIDPPEAMQLGATVTGRIKLSAPPGVEVPASALTEANGRPAVWVVDPQSQTVSLRNVEVLRYDPATVVISQGLETGEVVVTAGVQTLRPGQKVRLLGAVS